MNCPEHEWNIEEHERFFWTWPLLRLPLFLKLSVLVTNLSLLCRLWKRHDIYSFHLVSLRNKVVPAVFVLLCNHTTKPLVGGVSMSFLLLLVLQTGNWANNCWTTELLLTLLQRREENIYLSGFVWTNIEQMEAERSRTWSWPLSIAERLDQSQLLRSASPRRVVTCLERCTSGYGVDSTQKYKSSFNQAYAMLHGRRHSCCEMFLCLHQARLIARPREPYTPLWLVGSFSSGSRNKGTFHTQRGKVPFT